MEQIYARARVLCQQVGETPQLFEMLRGLCWYYRTRSVFHTARELGEQLYQLAQRAADPTHLLEAHDALGSTLLFLGEFAAARTHLEQGIALADPTEQRAQALRYGVAPGVWCRGLAAWSLWCLGYPTQAMQRNQEALALAQGLDHPLSLAFAQYYTLIVHHYHCEVSAVQVQAETLLTLATAHGFPQHVGFGTCFRGWALVNARPRRGGPGADAPGPGSRRGHRADARRTGTVSFSSPRLHGHVGQVGEGAASAGRGPDGVGGQWAG